MNKHLDEEDQIKRNIADNIAEKRLKEDFPFEMRRTLHLIGQHDLVGTMMAKAMEQGEFDNLQGAGRPINFNENPFEPSELRMVHKILKDNGYAPYWIEINKEINTLRAKLDREVEYFKKYMQIVFREKRSDWAISRYEQKKKNFYMQIRECLEEISKKILDYNLHCPVSTLCRSNFDIEVEMNRIVEDIENSPEGLGFSKR
jgi:DnaJ family protein C protein 28